MLFSLSLSAFPISFLLDFVFFALRCVGSFRAQVVPKLIAAREAELAPLHATAIQSALDAQSSQLHSDFAARERTLRDEAATQRAAHAVALQPAKCHTGMPGIHERGSGAARCRCRQGVGEPSLVGLESQGEVTARCTRPLFPPALCLGGPAVAGPPGRGPQLELEAGWPEYHPAALLGGA